MENIYLKMVKERHEQVFLYNTRTHPLIDKNLLGNAPQNMTQHLNYLNKVLEKTKWIFIAYYHLEKIGYSQIYNVQEDTVEIGFVVHPTHQNKGLGKKLVEETIKETKTRFKEKKIILYVLKSNLKAIHIYKKLGFIEKKLPFTDAITMGMELY